MSPLTFFHENRIVILAGQLMLGGKTTLAQTMTNGRLDAICFDVNEEGIGEYDHLQDNEAFQIFKAEGVQRRLIVICCYHEVHAHRWLRENDCALSSCPAQARRSDGTIYHLLAWTVAQIAQFPKLKPTKK